MTTKVLTVSELNASIKKKLEDSYHYLSVQGEISNLKAQRSGHFYFSLKDTNSQISAVLFKGHAARLAKLPREGDQVIAKGELSVYSPRGAYQLIIRELEYSGKGELLLRLHQYKQELKAKGWLDTAHKKALPKIPQKIGIVTSPTGAVIQDILHVLERRFSGFNLLLNPVNVQGVGAAQEIAQAIDTFNQYQLADVLIIGRGGGSIEDLWAFNEPAVAEAIFRSKIPIISAVGHETDYSISDLIADVRAPTPSAAAEIVIAEKEQLLKSVFDMKSRMKQLLLHRLQRYQLRLQAFVDQPAFSSPYYLLNPWIQKTDETRETLFGLMSQYLTHKKLQLESAKKQQHALKPQTQISLLKQKLTQYQSQLDQVSMQKLSQKKESIKHILTHLKAIDPKHLLNKGYSILFSEKDHSIILSANELVKGQRVVAKLHNGEAIATVDEIKTGDAHGRT